jgi:hypothetical protein
MTAKVEFITQSLNNLTRDDHICVLTILLNSQIEDSKIKEKPSGTQIKIADIPPPILDDIYEFVKRKIDTRRARMEQYTATDDTIKN